MNRLVISKTSTNHIMEVSNTTVLMNGIRNKVEQNCYLNSFLEFYEHQMNDNLDYIEDYLPNHFENAGMKCMKKIVCSASKCLSFIK